MRYVAVLPSGGNLQIYSDLQYVIKLLPRASPSDRGLCVLHRSHIHTRDHDQPWPPWSRGGQIARQRRARGGGAAGATIFDMIIHMNTAYIQQWRAGSATAVATRTT